MSEQEQVPAPIEQGPANKGEDLSWQDTADMINSTLVKGSQPHSAEDVQAMEQQMAAREGRPAEERVLRREPQTEDEKHADEINSTLLPGEQQFTSIDIAAMTQRMAMPKK